MSNGNGVTATLSQAADSVKETAGNIGSTIASTAGDAVATVRTSATRVRKAASGASTPVSTVITPRRPSVRRTLAVMVGRRM